MRNQRAIMTPDAALHAAAHMLTDVKWNTFPFEGIDAERYEWYYAEERLYAIHDKVLDAYHFIVEGSPLKALDVIRSKRPKGKWRIRRWGGDAQCSNCGFHFRDVYDIDNFDRFCRHCGEEKDGITNE